MLPKPLNAPQPTQPSSVMEDRSRRGRGTGFTNISRILGANVGAGTRMGQKIGTSLQSRAGEIRQGIEQGKSQFAAGKQAGSAEAESAIGAAGSLAKTAYDTSDQIPSAQGQQPGQDFITAGQKLRQAEYKGPEGLEQAGRLQSRAATGAALAKLGATAGGQKQLLASQVAQRGAYGKGLSEFDRMLLGREGQREIQTGRGSLAGIESETEKAITGAESEAAAKQAGIESAKLKQIQDIRNKLSGQGTAESEGIVGLKTKAEASAAQYSNDVNRLKELLSMSKDQYGNVIGTEKNPITERDKKLIDDFEAGKYGDVSGISQMYTGGTGEGFKQSLQTLSNVISAPEGGFYYSPGQQQAAANLALLLGDQGDAEKIRQSKYDTEAYKSGSQESVLKEQEDYRNRVIGNIKSDIYSKLNQIKESAHPDWQTVKALGGQELLNVFDKLSDEYVKNYGGGLDTRGGVFSSIAMNMLQKLGYYGGDDNLMSKYDWAADPRTKRGSTFAGLRSALGITPKEEVARTPSFLEMFKGII